MRGWDKGEAVLPNSNIIGVLTPSNSPLFELHMRAGRVGGVKTPIMIKKGKTLPAPPVIFHPNLNESLGTPLNRDEDIFYHQLSHPCIPNNK